MLLFEQIAFKFSIRFARAEKKNYNSEIYFVYFDIDFVL